MRPSRDSFFARVLPFLHALSALPVADAQLVRPAEASGSSAALSCPDSELPTYQQDHALAAFEQGDWLAELDLLLLADALQRTAITRGGYGSRSFDVMFAIADVLESDHGWSFEQSHAWLERMGLWEEEFCSFSAGFQRRLRRTGWVR